VRARGILSLSDAIRKITWGPAQRFRIPNKGNLAVGCDADIVVFDLESICDKADYVGFGDPNAPPLGIEYVLVNGEPVCRGTEVSGEKRTGVHVKAG
jgi:N-acyl-D-amino-acid deacylase